MPVVTSIAKPKKSRTSDTVELHLDGELWSTCSVAIVSEFGLYRGVELDAQQLEQIAQRIVERSALAACAAAVGRRALTERELAARLSGKDFSEAVVETTVARARELGLVDDRRYAQSFANSRLRRGHGERRIAHDLFTRGVARDIIDEVLQEVAGDEALVDRCVETVRKAYPPELLADPAASAKARRLLQRRGFTFEQINQAMRRLAS